MPGASRFALSLHSSIDELESDWLALQSDGLCSFFQTFEWCKAWYETAGLSRRIKPSIVCGRKENGQVAFILPFAVETHMGNRVLCWYGTAEITYGMGIYDRKLLATSPDIMEEVWPEIIKLIGNIDAISLEHQPDNWQGVANPLTFLFTAPGANRSYRMKLQSDYPALFAQKRSSSSRRGARKRDKKLLATGNVVFDLPAAGDETRIVINTMINQQQDRLGKQGILSVYDETRRAFLQRLAETNNASGQPVLLPFTLKIDGDICAVMLGGSFQQTYWALISSLTADTSLYALSPGDYALRQAIEQVCEAGFNTFDFASGDTDYKSHWSDETVQLYEATRGLTLKGRLWMVQSASRSWAKRTVKQTPWLFSLAKTARKFLLQRRTD